MWAACGRSHPIWGACDCCLRAGHTHGSLDLLFCGHTLERPGRNCLSCQARRNLNDAEGGAHMIHTRHFHGGATASNRAWSPPNTYDVMTGNLGPMDGSLEAELRADWLDAVERVTGFDPRQLRRRDFDRDRRPSRAIEHGVGPGALGNGPGQARALRSPREAEQGDRWVRDTHPRFGERDGRGEGGAARPGLPDGSGSAAGARDVGAGLGASDRNRASHGGSRYGEGQPLARGTRSGDGGQGPLDKAGAGRGGGDNADDNDGDGGGGPAEGGGRAANLRPGPGAHGDGTMTDRGEDDDADDGDGGPDRGGGRVASLVPGPGTGGRQGVGAQGTPEHGSEQPGPPPSDPRAEGGQEAAEPGAQAEGGDTGAGAPPVDSSQQDQGSLGWGWWCSGAWQSGSSHGGWWDRHRGNGDDGDAWARWNRGGHGVQPGSHSGYGGGGRRRPKPSEVAAALGRSLSREEWIEELILDPPNPDHPEFRSPGSWERWVRGAFRAHKKIGDAKYRVKTKRANADREVRGADPDYSARGGRAAAMDPSTAFDPREGHGCGQERRVRGRSDGYGRDATATGGAAAPSSSEWRTAAVDGGSSHHGDVGSTEPVLAAAGEAAPCAAPGGHVSSDGSGAPPPGLDGGIERHDDGDGAGAAALDAAAQAGARGCGDGTGLSVDVAGPAEGDLGQMDGAPGSLSRHGSPRPVVPSHCEGDTTATGEARPDGSLGGIGDEGPDQGHGDAAAGRASGAHDERVPLSPSGAACADGGAASSAQHCLHDVDGLAGALPVGDDVGHRDGALRVKVDARRARPPRDPT